MDNTSKDARSKYSTYGNGKAIIEILNIGFEPLLTDDEYSIYKQIGEIKNKIYKLNHAAPLLFMKNKMLYLDDNDSHYKWLNKHKLVYDLQLDEFNEEMKEKGEEFRILLKGNISITRKIHNDRDFKRENQFRNIAIFESDLTRAFGCSDMNHSDDIISVVTYYTEIFNSITHNGFDHNGKHFVFFTAGAGQTRCKKSTFVSEEQLDKNFNRLFCGLTKEDINKQGGMNTNKYLAYTSLCQSNTEIWNDFDINRAIVVDDIEYKIPNQQVRYIYTESPEDKERLKGYQFEIKQITDKLKKIRENKKDNPKGYKRPKEEIIYEKELRNNKNQLLDLVAKIKSKYHQSNITPMDIIIPFTDGFGISLKKMQSSMVRLPFVKGLMAYCPRRAFIDWCSYNNQPIHKIIDIYGKSYSITDVDYIFTKSQFKMWKYYNNEVDNDGNIIRTGWEVYKDNFKEYKCSACRCNVERNVKLNAKTNYQILQTLTTEMTDDNIKKLADYDINNLNGIGRNVQCMLNVLNANEKKNDNMNWLQKSLILYPEMLKDFYVKTLLKNTKDSMAKKFRSGKFNINGTYTFAIPDTLACLQWWFTDMDKTKISEFGFVKENHVTCNLFENKEEVDCLRSPHLDHAHCIRKNHIDEFTKKWAKSNGVYISMMDTMSKLLMYDNDGDKLLLHNNKTIIQCAKSFQQKYGMIPNYYDMPKAKPELLNNSSLFDGIVMAYHHGNIGTPSNEITKIWMTLNPKSTKEEINNAMEIIALRCMDVNFTIDYAKTLYKPTIPNGIIKKYKKYSGKNVPHFFVYAKGKTEKQVEKLGKCNIDRITNVVKSNKIVFKNIVGKYSYKNLLSDPLKDIDIKSDIATQIIELYRVLNEVNIRRLSHIDFSVLDVDEKKRAMLQLEFDSNKQQDMFTDIIGETKENITDILIKALQDDVNKDTLWRLFGDIIYENLSRNLKGTKICCKCKQRFVIDNDNAHSLKYCDVCKNEIMREKDKIKKQKKRNYA